MTNYQEADIVGNVDSPSQRTEHTDEQLYRTRLVQAVLFLERLIGKECEEHCWVSVQPCVLCKARATARNPQSDGESLQDILREIGERIASARSFRFGVISIECLAEVLLLFACEQNQELVPIHEQLLKALYSPGWLLIPCDVKQRNQQASMFDTLIRSIGQIVSRDESICRQAVEHISAYYRNYPQEDLAQSLLWYLQAGETEATRALVMQFKEYISGSDRQPSFSD